MAKEEHGDCVYGMSKVKQAFCSGFGHLLSIWSPCLVGLILLSLQRREQAQRGAKISSRTQLGNGNVRTV